MKIGEKWGYIDNKGNLVIQPQVDEANSFSEGVALVRVSQNLGIKSTEIIEEKLTETRGVWLTTTDSKVFPHYSTGIKCG
ncbi:MAG: WG repeat-containing protein [Potamolinea sp.]